MIEIVIILILWHWGLTPLWLNVTVSVLLYIRFTWRAVLTMCKVFELNESFEEKKERDTDGAILEEKREQARTEKN